MSAGDLAVILQVHGHLKTIPRTVLRKADKQFKRKVGAVVQHLLRP